MLKFFKAQFWKLQSVLYFYFVSCCRASVVKSRTFRWTFSDFFCTNESFHAIFPYVTRFGAASATEAIFYRGVQSADTVLQGFCVESWLLAMHERKACIVTN